VFDVALLAISFITGQAVSDAYATGTATHSLSFPGLPTVGNAFVTGCGHYGGATDVCAVGDAGSNAYTQNGIQGQGSDPLLFNYLFTAKAVSVPGSVPTDFTITVTAPTDVHPALAGVEYRGLNYSGTTLVTDGSSVINNGTGTAVDCGNIITTHADDLVVCVISAYGSGLTISNAGSSTVRTSVLANGALFGIADQIVSTPGTYHVTVTLGAATLWATTTTAFQGTAGAIKAIQHRETWR
jgi:hypothetical protein